MSAIILFDFEVFRRDTLLGTKIIDETGTRTYQTWDLEEIRHFYHEHKDDIWVGHNNQAYDNLILEAICNYKDPYMMSAKIVKSKIKPWCRMHLYYFDLMCQRLTPYSLKATELADGENISETEVDFNLPRALTDEEKARTESYNRDDLNRTEKNFYLLQSDFQLRLDILNEFNLSLDYLHVTGTKLAAVVLKAHKIDGIENMHIKPVFPPNLQLKNEALRDYFITEKFRDETEKVTLTIGGTKHQIGQGGIHAALTKYHTDRALYFDVSGYYNLTMLNYNLLPRSLDGEGAKIYDFMYHEQLKLKKKDPLKRAIYKKILLSVFGAMNNKYTEFYDPQKCLLVTITGQMFLVDLLEKLEPYIKIVQSNTDGIIVEPWDWEHNVAEWSLKDKIIQMVTDWETRTGYTIKKDEITDIYQRDVNCYFYRMYGELHTVGEAVRLYEGWDNIFEKDVFGSKEPAIYAHCIIDFFTKGALPEQTIEENKRHLKMFQYSARKGSFERSELQINHTDGSVEIERLQGVNRVFPIKDKDSGGTLYKCRTTGKVKRAKIGNIPELVFVYDECITTEESIDYLVKTIDFDYYIKRAYEKIFTFLYAPRLKAIDLSKYPADIGGDI